MMTQQFEDREIKQWQILEASNFRNRNRIFSNVVAGRVIVANNENLVLAVFADTNAEVFAVLPHHLREMSSSC
jgi:hypothetical protein